MNDQADVNQVATALQLGVGLFVRRFRQTGATTELKLPELSALLRLERAGSATPGELAKLEQITPQAMGATLGALETRGMVVRRSDPLDGRRAVMSLTDAGYRALRDRRTARAHHLAEALAASGFTSDELKTLMAAAPLIERLAHAI